MWVSGELLEDACIICLAYESGLFQPTVILPQRLRDTLPPGGEGSVDLPAACLDPAVAALQMSIHADRATVEFVGQMFAYQRCIFRVQV